MVTLKCKKSENNWKPYGKSQGTVNFYEIWKGFSDS